MSKRAVTEKEGQWKLGSSEGRSRAVRASLRDREVLAWVGRERIVHAEQLAAREWLVGRSSKAAVGRSYPRNRLRNATP